MFVFGWLKWLVFIVSVVRLFVCLLGSEFVSLLEAASMGCDKPA